MEVVQHLDPRVFADRARSFLIQRECEHCGLIGVADALADHSLPLGSDPLRLMFTVEDSGNVVGVAAQTRPSALMISGMAPNAAYALAQKLFEIEWPGQGCNGPAESANVLADRWCAVSGQNAILHVSRRVFQLTQVMPPAPAPGKMIVAALEHLPLINRWRDEFARAVGEPIIDPNRSAEPQIENKRMFLWLDSEPRAMAATVGPTPSGIRINTVYTPPPFRGRGYAPNLVAAVSNHQLSLGKRFCFLFTDVANPTSNKIYEQIGYTTVSDFQHWTFNQ